MNLRKQRLPPLDEVQYCGLRVTCIQSAEAWSRRDTTKSHGEIDAPLFIARSAASITKALSTCGNTLTAGALIRHFRISSASAPSVIAHIAHRPGRDSLREDYDIKDIPDGPTNGWRRRRIQQSGERAIIEPQLGWNRKRFPTPRRSTGTKIFFQPNVSEQTGAKLGISVVRSIVSGRLVARCSASSIRAWSSAT